MGGKILLIIEWLLLAAGLALISLPSALLFNPQMALIALALSFAMRVIRTRQLFPRTALNWPWLLFILATAWGAYISIHPEQAQAQFIRLVAAFVVFCAFLGLDSRWQRRGAWVLLIGMAFLALYWPIRHPFADDPVKFSLVNQAGMVINAAVPQPPGPTLFPNTTGGMLVLGIPFGLALAWISWKEKRRWRIAAALLLTFLVLGGLVLTSSRGAMLGLLAAVILTLLALLQTRRFPSGRQKVLFWILSGFLLAGLALGLLANGKIARLASPALQSREEIWSNGLPLVQDYAFTGAGLGTFPIVYSIYSLLIHVPYHEHMHNLFLETWYELGILGVVALVWGMLVALGWAWRALVPYRKDAGFDEAAALRTLGWASMAALVAMGVHGMVDVVFMLKRSLPLVGLVIGYVALLENGQRMVGEGLGEAVKARTKTRRYAWFGAGIGVLLLFFLFYRPLLGTWYANLGALAQTRYELSRYNPDQYDRPSLDQIRREGDYAAIDATYQKALRYDPTNRTAITRLASIMLSRGDYAGAQALLEQGQAASRNDRVLRLLYGDALVAQGKLEDAANTVHGLPWAEERLMFQAWYRYWVGGDQQRSLDAWKTVLLLEPGNLDAQGFLSKIP